MPLRLRLFTHAAVLLLCGQVVSAQRMMIADTRSAPVAVETAEIRTEVTGRIAVTTFDLTFRNPNGRVLEGTFEFPLLSGQTVVRFALDVGGRLREAVPVEKARGRVVFEEIERRRVDPGLLERTAGNNYRARVYPIPAGGTRRVVIAYQEALDGAEPHYRLPLAFADPLKTFRLRVAAPTGTTTPPRVHSTLKLELPPWQDARVLEVNRTEFAATGVLELDLPPLARPSVITENRDGAEYFYAEAALPAVAQVARPVPRVVGLLWDASGSGRDRDHERENALLKAWFAAVPNVRVKLIALRDCAAAPVTFTVTAGDWSALRRELDHLVYDGATSLDGLVDDPEVQEWLLFSDGLVNYGTTSARAKLPVRAPVHAILAAARADAARLAGLARQTGGEFVDLLRMPAADAVRALRAQSLRVISVERDPEAVAELFPERNTPLQGTTLIVTGRLAAAQARVVLHVGHTKEDAVRVELPVRTGENPGEFAARAWAAAKIAALETDADANREDIRRTSQAFGIVTGDSSLIVLESLQDYIRYDITPPAELRAEWEARRHTADIQRGKERETHLARVASAFAERKDWWQRTFPKDTPEPGSKDDEKRRAEPVALALAAPAFPDRTAVSADSASGADSSGEVIQLSPFAVAAPQQQERRAASTFAGSRQAMTFGGVAGEVSLGAAANAPAFAAAAMPGDRAPRAALGSIALKPWEPAAGYLDRLRRAEVDERYAIYLEERTSHARQPGFFLDVAGFFLEAKDETLGLRILSNLAELQLEDAALLRVLAHRLVEAGHPELARPLFERVLAMRPEEPQSRRDLALVCAALNESQRAVDLLWEVVAQPWNDRFPDIELIALGELNAIAATAKTPVDLGKVDPRLRKNLPVGLRAVLTWDADACDIDLWVDDPNGERAIYNHPRTYQGGRMSRDFTGGYGPEEFLLRDPKPGRYTIRINYFGERSQTAIGPVTAQVRLITGFGTPEQKEKRLTVRLNETKQSLEIGTIEIEE